MLFLTLERPLNLSHLLVIVRFAVSGSLFAYCNKKYMVFGSFYAKCVTKILKAGWDKKEKEKKADTLEFIWERLFSWNWKLVAESIVNRA